ncbi:MAG: AEC family transporter [Paracoccaceae bacterium]
MAAFFALFPVFLVILLGVALRRFNLVEDAHWLAIDQFCYRVLFPALIFKEIAAADFSTIPVFSMALAMIAAILSMAALLVALRHRINATLQISPPQFASLFQGATRWHTFIALAIIPVMFGADALALGALGAAAMIPFLNVMSVWLHAATLGTGVVDARAVAVAILRNPFVLSSVAGVLWQALRLPMPWPMFEVLDIVGKGALGLALIAAGGGLQFAALHATRWPVALAVTLKLLVMPLLMWGWCLAFGVTGTPATIAILCGAVPTASGAYVLARQMGGDAPLVASILTVQVIAATFTIPLVLTIAAYFPT